MQEASGGLYYKIITASAWREAQRAGEVAYGEVDIRDGYMHLSTGAQVLETARLHFRGQRDLVALEVDPVLLVDEVRFEPSRGGDLFPHLYGALPASAVIRARPLVEEDGAFRFDEEASR